MDSRQIHQCYGYWSTEPGQPLTQLHLQPVLTCTLGQACKQVTPASEGIGIATCKITTTLKPCNQSAGSPGCDKWLHKPTRRWAGGCPQASPSPATAGCRLTSWYMLTTRISTTVGAVLLACQIQPCTAMLSSAVATLHKRACHTVSTETASPHLPYAQVCNTATVWSLLYVAAWLW